MKRRSEEDGRRALRDHVIEKALIAREKYGESLDEKTLVQILADPDVVRYPTTIKFDAGPLEEGEFAYVEPLGPKPSDGFCMYVHPHYRGRDDVLPLLVVYQFVRVNYGEIATHEDAELFGATFLGKDVDDYYETLCELADELSSAGAC